MEFRKDSEKVGSSLRSLPNTRRGQSRTHKSTEAVPDCHSCAVKHSEGEPVSGPMSVDRSFRSFQFGQDQKSPAD